MPYTSTDTRAQQRPSQPAWRGDGIAHPAGPYADGPRRDLLELAASGAPIGESLNAVVRAVAQVRTRETRAAIFIFDPAAAHLRFAAAEGLSESYTSQIDRFPVAPEMPSCGKAAYIGNDVIVGDVASDPAWAPFLQLAIEHEIGACWSFLLRGAQGRVLGTFALYHRVPCTPDTADYEEVRYFVNIASLMVGRHVEAEERRREQAATEEGLRAANRHKDAFLATLAHELRNPLSAISNCVSVLRQAGEQAPARAQALTLAERQLAHMERLIEDLLDANRLTRGELALRRERTALLPAVELAIAMLRPLFASRCQPFAATLPRQPVWLDADAVRVTQMLANLLTNAHKFTPFGAGIFLDVEVEDSDVVIRVRDEGIGIAANDLDAIFTMFSQIGAEGPAGDGANQGLGIGLSLVRQLAGMHGGSVAAHSAGEGGGSTFVLRLPRLP